LAYIGVQPADAYTSFAVQHFTTSATDTFTLDFPVANENEIALFINNVRQEPGSSYAYTASGTTLTLSAATSASDTMYCVFIGKAVQTVTPANGSVTNDMLAGSIANAKLANSSITLNGSAVSLGGSATVGGSNTPNFKADLASNQSVSATTWTKLNLSQEIFDTNSNYDTSNYRFTPTTAGKYFFTGSAGNNTSMNYLYVSVYKNGVQALQAQATTSSAGIINCSGILEANGSSDYFEFFVFPASSTTITADAHRTYFSGFKLIE
jgi:hypothetical protein